MKIIVKTTTWLESPGGAEILHLSTTSTTDAGDNPRFYAQETANAQTQAHDEHVQTVAGAIGGLTATS